MKNRNRVALLIVILFLLGTGSIAAYQSFTHTIVIIDDGKVTQYETRDVYVGDVLESQNISLGQKDTIEPSVDTEIEDGTKIVIERWYPNVNLIINGEENTFTTKELTVGDFLESQDIQIVPGVESVLPLTHEITDELDIIIKTTEMVIEIEEEEIAFEVQHEMTNDLPAGEIEVVSEGKAGLLEKTIQIVQFGGEEVSRSVIEETVLAEPETRVVREGLKKTITDPTTGKVYEYTHEITMDATAYTDIPGDRWYGITASGMPTFLGMVAVDRSLIPLGTILYVEDYGIAIAGDVGGAIKGYDIDLFMNTYEEAIQFGRRDKQVFILKDQTIDVRAERAGK